MAAKFFVGTAASTAQVDTLTVGGTVEAGDKFLVTMTGEDGSTSTITVSATTTSTSTTATEIAAEFNASTHPLFTAVTALAASSNVTLTADVAGVPFYATVATTESNDAAADAQTFTRAATTASSQAGDWNTAANWSDRAVPVTSDDVTLDARMATAIVYGLRQTAVTLATLNHVKGAKQVGTPTAPLAISVTAGDINKPPADGSSPSAAFFALNTGTNATALNVWDSPNTGTSGVAPVSIKGAHASNVYRQYGGTAAIATQLPGDTANFPSITVIGSTAKLTIGSGASTITALTAREGATVTLRAAATTVDTSKGAKLVTEGAGAIATANIDGEADLNSTGTVTTLNIQNVGRVDTTKTPLARTITNCNVYGGGTLKTDLNTTYTNGKDIRHGALTSQVSEPDGIRMVTSATP